MNALIEERNERPSVRKVEDKLLGRDVEHTMSRVEPEVSRQ